MWGETYVNNRGEFPEELPGTGGKTMRNEKRRNVDSRAVQL